MSFIEPGAYVRRHDRSLLATAARYERGFWGLAVAAMVLDITLTLYGLRIGLVEMNPIASRVITQYGALGMVAMKGFGFGVAVFGRQVVHRRYAALVPLALALPWVVAVCVNVVMIATVL
ncbi:DUF5658 family protein [Halomarina ordinaria]|uniref:DUF5658 family protein n=1 Tax=Halomarina ordinaria TaxID=3033939 RepID=A0ABD5UCH1_9EURY|nr:DUF5658 family protein [Halomarina sp. PSRA2]